MASTIFITGATDGIGRKTAESLAATGADLIIHGRTPAKLEAVVAALEAIPGHGRIESLAAELSDLDAVRDLAARVSSTLGERPLDVLLNNAGVFMNELARSPRADLGRQPPRARAVVPAVAAKPASLTRRTDH
jgi:NAD(P)-dependent dehydrogenase (short-subunit alcohol dehydrogenase family)